MKLLEKKVKYIVYYDYGWKSGEQSSLKAARLVAKKRKEEGFGRIRIEKHIYERYELK